MSVQLRRETEQQIEDQLKVGKYHSADEVVVAGLNLLKERTRIQTEDVAEVRRKIAVGLQQLDAGEGIDGDQVFDELLSALHDGEAT